MSNPEQRADNQSKNLTWLERVHRTIDGFTPVQKLGYLAAVTVFTSASVMGLIGAGEIVDDIVDAHSVAQLDAQYRQAQGEHADPVVTELAQQAVAADSRDIESNLPYVPAGVVCGAATIGIFRRTARASEQQPPMPPAESQPPNPA